MERNLKAVEQWRREQEEKRRKRERAEERARWRDASPVALALREALAAAGSSTALAERVSS